MLHLVYVNTSVIAHRGASSDAPENTLAAFQLAWEQGADAIELDVHRTKDGRLVVIHDSDTRRTTGERGAVAQQSASVLRQFDAGSWKGARWRAERLPLLEEVLEIVPSSSRVYVELKTDAECLPELHRVIGGCAVRPEQVVLMSSDYETMQAARSAISTCACGWIIDRPWKAQRLSRVLERAARGGLQCLAFSSEWPLEDGVIEAVHGAGLRVDAWTVDEPRRARALARAGIDGIITNVPRLIIEALSAP